MGGPTGVGRKTDATGSPNLLIESVWFAGLGGAGLLLAVWGVDVLFKLLPPLPHLPVGYEMRLSGSVLLFSAGLTVLTGVLFGLVRPGRRRRPNLNEPLKQTGANGRTGRRPPSSAHGVGDRRSSLGGGVLTGMTLMRAQPATSAQESISAWIPTSLGGRIPPAVIGYDDERTRHTYRRSARGARGVARRREASPSRTGCHWVWKAEAALALPPPLSARSRRAHVCRHQHRLAALFRYLAHSNSAGREFDERDDFAAARVVVINHGWRTAISPGRDPLGLNVEFWGRSWRVVGLAKNGPYRALNEPGQPFLYVCEPQVGDRSLAAVVRSAGEPRALAQAVEQTAMAIDPLLKPMAALALTEYTAGAFIVPRMAAILVAALGGWRWCCRLGHLRGDRLLRQPAHP